MAEDGFGQVGIRWRQLHQILESARPPNRAAFGRLFGTRHGPFRPYAGIDIALEAIHDMPIPSLQVPRARRAIGHQALRALIVALFLELMTGVTLAYGQGHAQDASNDSLRLYIEQAAGRLPGRVEVILGRLDERLQLAPCQRVEPYVPPGTRLWGRARVGLRCLEGANWNVYLPVEIKVFGPALVASRPLAYGQIVGPDDTRVDEVELSREPGNALTDAGGLEGKTAARGIAAGQVLRAEYFRTPPVVSSGDTVRLVLNGAGFTVTASGRTLSSAQDGESVRVQTDSGRVVQGVARPGKLVELRL